MPRPANAIVYELTPRGRALEDAVLALGRWGAPALGEPRAGEIVTGDSMVMALRTTFRPEHARGLHVGYALRLGPLVLHARVDDGTLAAAEGPLAGAELVITTATGLRRCWQERSSRRRRSPVAAWRSSASCGTSSDSSRCFTSGRRSGVQRGRRWERAAGEVRGRSVKSGPLRMDPVSLFLLTVAGILLIGIIGEVVFEKTSVPDVVWLIAVGAVLGPVTGLVSRPMLEGVAPFFGALTLVVVLFEGGSRLRLSELTHAAPRASLLALLSFAFSAAAVTGVVMAGVSLELLPSNWTIMHGVTLGAILGGSSSVVIMPAMSKARLAPRLANLVNLESALTDVLCVVVTVACIEIMVSGTADPKLAAAALGRSFGVGLGIGALAGTASLLFLRMLKRSEYAYPALLGALLILYVVVGELGGSAALAILAVAVLVGNAPSLGKLFGLADDARLGQGVRHVHTQLAFIIKSFFFTFIGAMLGPPLPLMAIGALVAVLLLVVRVPATWLATVGGRFSSGGRALVGITLPRGMAAGVLAMLPHHAGVPNTEYFPVLAFSAVVVTIMLFATAFPLVKGRLGPEDLAPAASPSPQKQAPMTIPALSEPPEPLPEPLVGPAPGGEASDRA